MSVTFEVKGLADKVPKKDKIINKEEEEKSYKGLQKGIEHLAELERKYREGNLPGVNSKEGSK